MRKFLWVAAGLGLAATAHAASRGYLTTPRELARIRERAASGVEPYRSAVGDTIAYAEKAQLPAPDQGRVACSASRLPVYATSGAAVNEGTAVFKTAVARPNAPQQNIT